MALAEEVDFVDLCLPSWKYWLLCWSGEKKKEIYIQYKKQKFENTKQLNEE